MIYRLYVGADNTTGEVAQEAIIGEVSKTFEGFTVFNSLGYWRGVSEKAIVIEIVETPDVQERLYRSDVMSLAERIKVVANQQAVLMVETAGAVSMV